MVSGPDLAQSGCMVVYSGRTGRAENSRMLPRMWEARRSWAPGDERLLKTEKVEEITNAGPRRGVAVTGEGLAVHECVLEAEEVEDIQDTITT